MSTALVDAQPAGYVWTSGMGYLKIACYLSPASGGGDSRHAIISLHLRIAGKTEDEKHYLVECDLGWSEITSGFVTRFKKNGVTMILQWNHLDRPTIDIVPKHN